MSKLEEHAEFELRRAGLFDADSDYDGAIGPAVMGLVREFTGNGHSGYSARLTLELFNRVAQYKALTPLTSAADEWNEIDEDMRSDRNVPMWQSRRQPSCFSNDGGATYYDVNAEGERVLKTSEPAK